MLLKCVPDGPINKKISIGSNNGLEPSRPQAVIWTNDGLVCWRMSLDLQECACVDFQRRQSWYTQ